MRPIAIIYENETWMAPLFASLDDAGAEYERVFANDLSFDPAGPAPEWSLAVNKVSPSSYLRGHARSIAVARELLPLLEGRGVPVVNGSRAFALETSKARQLLLLQQLGIRAPAARVITDAAQAVSAARELHFPVIVKPNVGGSGARMRRFASPEDLAAHAAEVDLGPDGAGLVQEFIESEDGTSRRVEFLDGEYLYAIRIAGEGGDFNLCPADICRTDAAPSPVPAGNLSACPADGVNRAGLSVTRFDPPDEAIDTVLRITRAASIDVGGVEYMVGRQDGRIYYYDVNATSNFVANAPEVLGFDPTARFADFITRVARTGTKTPDPQ